MALKNMLTGATSAVHGAGKAGTGFFSDANKWALRLVFIAGIATVLKKAGIDVPNYAVVFAACLGIAALMYESSASRDMLRAFWTGRPVSALCALVVWSCAFGYSINNWVGVASENQVEKTNLHRTALNASVDTRKVVGDLELHLKLLNGKSDWSKSLDAPDSYAARIKAAQEDATYEETRGGCKSKCIAKKQLAASLEADRVNAGERLLTVEEIKSTQAKLDAARQVASATKVETSEERNDLLILTKLGGMTEQGAQIFNGLFSILVVSLFISFGSMRAELDDLRKAGPRVKLHLFSRALNWLMRLWDADTPLFNAKSDVHNHQHITVQDAVGRAVANVFAKHAAA